MNEPSGVDPDVLHARLYLALRDGYIERVELPGPPIFRLTEKGAVRGRVLAASQGLDPDQISASEMLALVAYASQPKQEDQ